MAIYFIKAYRTKGVVVCRKDNSVNNSRDCYHRLSGIMRMITFHPGKQHTFFKSTVKGEKYLLNCRREYIIGAD